MLENLQPKSERYTCAMARLLDKLSKTDREILENALTDRRWTGHALVSELRARELPIGNNDFYRHKRKECTCWRT